MKTRRIYASPNLAAAQAALAAARDTGIERDALSLIARSDIEMDAVPDDLREAHTDMVPAALRGADIARTHQPHGQGLCFCLCSHQTRV